MIRRRQPYFELLFIWVQSINWLPHFHYNPLNTSRSLPYAVSSYRYFFNVHQLSDLPDPQLIHESYQKEMADFDIAQFLRELPKVPLEEVPTDNRKCPICHTEYLEDDTDLGYTEHPTMLPCTHIIGRHCLTTWLKPTPGGNANTCPLCRLELFDPWPAPSESETSEEDENDYVEPINTSIARLSVSIARQHGYAFGPYLGHIEDNDARQLAFRRIEANRRAVSLREAELYIYLQKLGFRPAGNLDPGELLDYDQDQALFECLQRQGAFRGICLNEEFREELEGPMRGDRLDDYTMWSRLRDQGAYWRVENLPQGTGRWVTSLGEPLQPHEDRYSPNVFEDLSQVGAFSTPAITLEFGSRAIVSEYRIFRELVDLGRIWDASRRIWTSGSDEGTGNLDSAGQEHVTPRPRRGPRVIDTGPMSPSQTLRRPDPSRRPRLWDGRPAGWSSATEIGGRGREEAEESEPSPGMDAEYSESEDDGDDEMKDDD